MARRTSLTNTRLISELNMTSIMDLTFLLLLTFMITFPNIEQGIPVRLPKGQASSVGSLAQQRRVAAEDRLPPTQVDEAPHHGRLAHVAAALGEALQEDLILLRGRQ